MAERIDTYWLPSRAQGKGAGKSASEQVRAAQAQTGAAAEAQGGNAQGQTGAAAEAQGGNARQQRDDFYAWFGIHDDGPRAQAPPRTDAAQGQAHVLTTWVDMTEADAPHLVESIYQGVFLDPYFCEIYTDTTPPYRRWYWHDASKTWAWEPQNFV